MPGQSASSGAFQISSCALVSMLPQLGIGGWMPRPKKLSTLSNLITSPTASAVATRIGEIVLGRTWNSITRQGGAPMATAARTKSRDLSDSVAARTSRATVVQLNSAVISTMRTRLA